MRCFQGKEKGWDAGVKQKEDDLTGSRRTVQSNIIFRLDVLRLARKWHFSLSFQVSTWILPQYSIRVVYLWSFDVRECTPRDFIGLLKWGDMSDRSDLIDF